MPDEPRDLTPEDEADVFAGEHVLGLLDPAAAAVATRRAAVDPAFAASIAAWETRLIPLIGRIAPLEPSPALWPRIAAGLPVTLGERRAWWDSLTLWRASTGIAVAAAAALAVMVMRPVPPPAAGTPAAPPVRTTLASTRLQTGQGRVLFVITLDADSHRVVVTPVSRGGLPGHAHELWLLPPAGQADGKPVSLGVMPTDESASMPVPVELEPGSSLAISVEPAGGSPTGQPTGPVVASGRMTRL